MLQHWHNQKDNIGRGSLNGDPLMIAFSHELCFIALTVTWETDWA